MPDGVPNPQQAKEHEDFDQELVAETDEPRPEMSEEQQGPRVLLPKKVTAESLKLLHFVQHFVTRVVRPKKVTVKRHAAGLTVTYTWRHGCLGWLGWVLFAVTIGFLSLGFYFILGWSLYIVALFWIAFAYAGIAHWVNRTTFHVTKQEILVSGGPMPWYHGFGTRKIQVSDLDKLDVTWHRSGDSEGGWEWHTLRAVLKDGKNVPLLQPDSASAHMIRRQINKYLGRTRPRGQRSAKRAKRAPEAQKLLQEFVEELTRRGFEVSPRSERLYYHPDVQDVRFTIQQRVIRLEKRHRLRLGHPWERDESFSILHEIPLALEVADKLVGQSKRRHT